MYTGTSTPGPDFTPQINAAAMREELNKLSREDLALLEWRLKWRSQARPKQLPPDDPCHGMLATPDWVSWGIRSGRGFGKTRSAANWLGLAAADQAGSFNCVIAPTRDDVRYTCFEGETGLLAYLPDCLILDYNKSDLLIYLWNGSIIRGFGSERPDKLRGPQHHNVWGEEVAAWTNAKETWSNMKFGHRLGMLPRLCWTTTPKPVPIIKQLSKAADNKKHFMVLGSTDENRKNLPQSFYDEVAKYRGTKLGRQELEGELIDPEEDGIVTRSQWRLWPANKSLPHFITVIMSLDTAFTEKTYDKKTQEADPSGCEVWGLFEHDKKLNVMMIDAWDEYLGFPELVAKVRVEYKKRYGLIDKPLVGQPLIPSPHMEIRVADGTPINQILVEDKGSGISLRQTLSMENLLMEPYNPGRADKLARLHQVSPMFAHGRVWTVESSKRPGEPRAWADKAIGEICAFHGEGTTEHDEYVDCCTQALTYFMRLFIFTFVERTPEQIVEEKEKLALEEMNLHDSEHPYG
jgi:phage terminase large subunit-like protein